MTFMAANRNKRSIEIDAKSEAGRDLLFRLAGAADVIVENFRPPVLKRMGIDYDSVAAANPRGCQVIEHRYFAGLSLEESAQALGVSVKTVHRDYLASRAWLRKELHGA